MLLVCASFFHNGLVVKAKRVCVTCLGEWSRGGSHGLLCCVMSVPCLIGDQLGQMQQELCFLTSPGRSVPSTQPTLLQPHQSPACQFAQTASKYLLYWLRVLHWSAKDWSHKMHTWCLPNLQHFLPVVVRSLICVVLTRQATAWSGSFVRHS